MEKTSLENKGSTGEADVQEKETGDMLPGEQERRKSELDGEITWGSYLMAPASALLSLG